MVLVIVIVLVLIKCILKFCNILDWIVENFGLDLMVNFNGLFGFLLKNNLVNGNLFVLMLIFVEYCVVKIKVLVDELIVFFLIDCYI